MSCPSLLFQLCIETVNIICTFLVQRMMSKSITEGIGTLMLVHFYELDHLKFEIIKHEIKSMIRCLYHIEILLEIFWGYLWNQSYDDFYVSVMDKELRNITLE